MRITVYVILLLYFIWRLLVLFQLSAAPVPSKARSLMAVGQISSIPVCHHHGCRFMFLLAKPPHRQFYLSWYGRHAKLQAGQSWLLSCRLRGANKRMPAYFRRWLWSHAVVAEGYVDHHKANFRLNKPVQFPVLRLRQQIQDHIADIVHEPALAGVIAALTVGSRALLAHPQWQVFQRTGTSHLVAISGLHVGLVALACYRIFLLLSRRSVLLMSCWPAQQWASVAALMAASGYAVLAGMSLPTQRALIMLFAYYLPGLCYLQVPVWRRLVLAFVVIIALEPAAMLQSGFWLSFAAVASIAYVLRGRLRAGATWREWLRLHMATSVGLVPLTLFFFEKVSLVMLLANAVAVPWVTLLIVPMSLLACLSALVWPLLGKGLLELTAHLLAPLWFFLQWLSAYPFAVWYHSGVSFYQLFVSSLGALLLLSPLRLSVRLMGLWYIWTLCC